MVQNKLVHCFFEQSGTFKNAFIELGINALDYDMKNDFGETDCEVDLFEEIDKAYYNMPSIFDNIIKDDLIMAFFPCVRFEDQIILHYRGQSHGMKNWSLQMKIRNCMQLHDELNMYYNRICQLYIICIDRELKLIVENPYSNAHYLNRYWCVQPSIIDFDRRERGDYFKKPTQYWFLNCKPKNNIIFEISNDNSIKCSDTIRTMTKKDYEKTGAKNSAAARSIMHEDYASRFIREFIL